MCSPGRARGGMKETSDEGPGKRSAVRAGAESRDRGARRRSRAGKVCGAGGGKGGRGEDRGRRALCMPPSGVWMTTPLYRKGPGCFIGGERSRPKRTAGRRPRQLGARWPGGRGSEQRARDSSERRFQFPGKGPGHRARGGVESRRG